MEGNSHRGKAVDGNDFPQLRRHEVQQGIFLSLLDGKFEKDAVSHFEHKRETVEFNFILSGRARASVRRHTDFERIDVQPGTFMAIYLPSSEGDFSISAGQDVRMLGIELELAQLESLFAQQDSGLLKRLHVAPETLFNNSLAISPAQKMVARQMLACSLSGVALTLFLQAKTLEMLAYQIELFTRFESRDDNARPHEPLPLGDEKKVRRARELLKEQMADPPNLEELARLCHLNVGKLKKGFRSVFGSTAFGCLHEDRMERAHQLLSTRQMNVSQVAWEVGYTNVGHFSVAFRKAYGESPKKFQQQLALFPEMAGHRFRLDVCS